MAKPKRVYQPKNSPFYHFDFRRGGERFYGSTGCTVEREAEAVARDEYEKAGRALKAKKAARGGVSLMMDDATERYWQEKGQYHAGSDNTDRDLERLVKYFGKTKLLTEITGSDVAKLVAWRRAQRAAPHNLPKGKKPEDYPLISNATVNRSTTEVLKKLFTHAKNVWKIRFDDEPFWKAHMLKEPKERVRFLVGDEGARLEAVTRDDYADFFEFVGIIGFRQEDFVELRWREVIWEAGQIVVQGKDGYTLTAPITTRVREILESCRGNHKEFVFTYVAARSRRARKAGETYQRTGNRKNKGESYVAERDQEERIKGRRYPMTISGVNSAWDRMRKLAGVEGFRFHDFRHDLATKLLRQTHDLGLVQKTMNHADIRTTRKYAHVMDEDVARALEAFHESKRSSAGMDAPKGASPERAPTQNRDVDSRNKSRSRRLRAI